MMQPCLHQFPAMPDRVVHSVHNEQRQLISAPTVYPTLTLHVACREYDERTAQPIAASRGSLKVTV